MFYLAIVILGYGITAGVRAQIPVWEAGRNDCFGTDGVCYGDKASRAALAALLLTAVRGAPCCRPCCRPFNRDALNAGCNCSGGLWSGVHRWLVPDSDAGRVRGGRFGRAVDAALRAGRG